MKRVRAIALALAACMVFTLTGCDRANSKCTAVGDEFVQAMLDMEFDDMVDLCKDDDEAEALLQRYDDKDDIVELFLSNATFEASEAECSTKDGTGTVKYTITLPNIEDAYAELPSDMDDLEEMITSLETTELSFKIKFKLKNDNWLITNIDSILEDTYDYLYGFDFCFYDYDSIIVSRDWTGSTTDDGNYSGFAQYLSYEANVTSPIDIELTYTYSYEGEEIYSDTIYGPISGWLYLSVEPYSIDDSYTNMPAGDYSIVAVDTMGRVVISDEVTVEEVNYSDYFDHDNWYGASSEPNIYSYSTTYIDYDMYMTEYISINTNVEFYYEGELVLEEEIFCSDYAYYYLYADDMTAAGYEVNDGHMPAGNYEVKIYDSTGNLISSGDCVVNEYSVLSYTNWYAASESPNIYDHDDSYLDFDLHYNESIDQDVTFTYYYNGEAIFTDTYYSYSYTYCYLYIDDLDSAYLDANGDFLTGEYTVTVWFEDGTEIATSTCIVR